MAKIVIAGKADCPYLARCELLGDKLVKNLPDFKLHKVVKKPDEWETYLQDTCNSKGWQHKKSPLVWRELIDRGGKGVLIGGANEFQEYAHGYYGVESEMFSHNMTKVAGENLVTRTEVDKEEAEIRALSKPIHMCISHANSPVAYGLINSIGSGDVFGHETEICLHLLDNEDKIEELKGVAMEARDLSHGLLREVNVTSDVGKAFASCSVIVILDEVEQNDGEDKATWIRRNYDLFTNYAKFINSAALKDVKVLLAGDGPLNFNIYMMLENMPDIPRRNISAVSRSIENSAKAIIAERLEVNSAGVVDLIVWGNTNGKTRIDCSKALVRGYDGAIWGPSWFSRPVVEMVHDDKWLETEFVETVNGRAEKKRSALNHPASLSLAGSVSSSLLDWWQGTNSDRIYSLVVASEGWYDIPEGVVFSFPVKFDDKGDWHVVKDIPISEDTVAKLKECLKDFESEKEVIYPPPYVPPPTPSPPPEKQSPEPEPQPAEADDGENKNENAADENDAKDQELSDDNKPQLEKIEEVGESGLENTDNDD